MTSYIDEDAIPFESWDNSGYVRHQPTAPGPYRVSHLGETRTFSSRVEAWLCERFLDLPSTERPVAWFSDDDTVPDAPVIVEYSDGPREVVANETIKLHLTFPDNEDYVGVFKITPMDWFFDIDAIGQWIYASAREGFTIAKGEARFEDILANKQKLNAARDCSRDF